MNNWKIDKTVDLARGIDGVDVWPHALLIENDSEAHMINVTVMDDRQPATLSGTANAYFVRSDDATIIEPATVEGNVVSVTLPKACYAYEGDLKAIIRITDGDSIVTLAAFLFYVRQVTTNYIVDPENVVPSLEDLLNKISDIETAIRGANEATENANTAADNANKAAEAAQSVMGDIESALDEASKALADAQQTKELSEGALSDAERALEDANKAVSDANDAAENTNKAIADAETATQKANDAADEAGIATQNANEKASVAEQSAKNADNAADSVQAVKEAAEEATNKAIEAAKLAEQAAVTGLQKEVLDQIPEPSEMVENVIYLVPAEKQNPNNVYDEYTLINGQRELIGSTAVDLTGYAKKDELAEVATSGSFADLTGTDGVATKEYVGEQIDAVEIGGTNLFRDSGNLSNIIEGRGIWTNSTWGHLNRGTITKVEINDAPNNNIHFGVHLEKGNESGVSNKMVTFCQQQIPLSIGQTYTVSYYVKGSGSTWINYEAKGLTPKMGSKITASNEWKRNSLTFVAEGASYFLGFYTENDGDITICGMKLEVGNKATDWSPAPEDVNAKINGIEIGGTNLMQNSTGNLGDTSFWTGLQGTIEFSTDGYNGSNCIILKRTNFVEGKGRIQLGNGSIKSHMVALGSGADFVLSGYYYVDSSVDFNGENNQIHIRFGQENLSINFYDVIATEFGSDVPRDKWIRFSAALKTPIQSFTNAVFKFSVEKNGCVRVSRMKIERGNKPTDWSPAPEDIHRSISRRAVVTYDYGGKNLKEAFGSAEALHNALAAEDYSNIAVGDYWPITLSGTFWDYGSFAVPSGVKYYSDNGLQTEAGTTAAAYEGLYVSETAVSITISEKTYYVAASECTDHIVRTCNNAAVKLEVAGINHYWRYGDSGDLTGNKNHIVFISRDCLPFWMRMRKANTHWESTAINNPWIGSAMFKTLNDETHGVLPLVAATDVGAYIYAGPNKLGMRAQLETKAPDAANATGWAWYDRGKLFLPSVAEVWGHPFWAEMNWEGGLGNQFAIFRDSRRHISKGGGDNAGRTDWWLGSSYAGNTTNFARFNGGGYASGNAASFTHAVPVCFIFA